ncbi:unnamed protein product [Neospora caninum Liverpool]|uniref:Toxoplasma gondii family A protein n=1 Tax=Neospora caninum (strain Liverpool) TaxID=572307 RepID=F0VRJ3_NEOCL|nr:uncharacterized protein NCLIV_067660 [Neospora caninum Liverpool]CBZ56341.1 unnamed protein product [Neospora caninum Liverpool]CEL71101.1 TPA: hypothetical protein BN1204_067660 [Neospora caninum Liverpool]|eukprot:XP_003886366.1 uncharacterized protein NCLIV_067660 [Neospora caninum Liverpool]
MERQLFRAACLTLILGTVLSCVASDTTGLETEADFKTTIPKEGLQRDLEQVFSLGPSSTLQVIDETGKAVYLPEPSQSVDGASSGPYSAAYRFDNGACDFSKTIEFKDAFPGYTKPLWVHEDSDSVESGKVSVRGPVRYTFTNPPAEYLGGGLSFCVRFKTVVAAGSDAETSTSTTATSSDSSNDSQTETPPEEEEHLLPGDQHVGSGGGAGASGGGGGGSGSHGVEDLGEGGRGESAEPAPSTVRIDNDRNDAAEPHTEHNGAQRLRHGGGSQPESGAPKANENPAATPAPFSTEETSGDKVQSPTSAPIETSTPTIDVSVPEDGQVTGDANARADGQEGSVSEKSGTLSRRLSETNAGKEAYLTILVHSAAWVFANGLSATSVFLLAAAATLLPIS